MILFLENVYDISYHILLSITFGLTPALGPNEIRVNVLYAGLCHSDCMTVRSLWGPAPYPIALGHEMVCEVSQVGSEVKDFKKGDLVGFGTQRDCCDKC